MLTALMIAFDQLTRLEGRSDRCAGECIGGAGHLLRVLIDRRGLERHVVQAPGQRQHPGDRLRRREVRPQRVVGEAVISRFEHADLNADPLFSAKVPTTENLAIAIWGLLAPKLGADRLWRVRVWEDPTLYVDYFGE